MLTEELRRLLTWSERHRRLVSHHDRLLPSAVVDLVGGLLMWLFERGAKGTEIHDFGDALFFSTVQILTISSSLKNPITGRGRIVDIVLEIWAVFVITALAGSFASFFRTGDLT